MKVKQFKVINQIILINMNAVKMSKDEFAKFIFNIGLNEVESYNYDVMYDIFRIMELHKESVGNTNKKQFISFSLFIRKSGTNICFRKDDEYYNYCVKQNDVQFDIVLCINCNYFSNQEYANITKIK